MANHLFDAIRQAGSDDGKPAIETLAGERIAYAELWAQSAQTANALISLGVRPDDRIAVQVEKHPLALVIYLGCLRAGGIFLPLNPGYTATEIDYFLGDSEPKLFICDPSRRDSLAAFAFQRNVAHVETLGAGGEGSMAGRIAAAPAQFSDCARGPDDLAAILYTSGTTGRSKGAMLSHDNLLSNALALRSIWRFTASDVLIHALPIFHTHGLFVATNIMLLAGGSMIFLPKFDADQIMQAMPRATSMMGVPTFYARLLLHPGLSREAVKHMRLFVSGSAPLLAETHREWRERTGHAILERYGMTETNMITSNPYDGARIAGAVGQPLPDVELRIADPDSGEGLPAGDIGVIEVRGPNVFKGYWRMPEKTKAEFRPDGFFITGDLGRIDENGYVSIVGRSKDLIITGGFNVYPSEVESEIDAIPAVAESAVIGLPHRDFGEAVTAVIVLRDKGALTERDILAAIAGRLAKFKLPKRILLVGELPRNAMGKVQKNILRERYGGLYQAGAA